MLSGLRLRVPPAFCVMTMTEFVAESESDTDAFAARLAAMLRPGDVLALEGPMGAGKTRLVRGLVKALGGDVRRVSSPTFVLLNIYPCPGPTLYHLDAYRLNGEEDLEAIGFSELLTEQGVVVVEWPSRVPGLIPPGALRLTLEPLGETRRRFTLSGRDLPP